MVSESVNVPATLAWALTEEEVKPKLLVEVAPKVSEEPRVRVPAPLMPGVIPPVLAVTEPPTVPVPPSNPPLTVTALPEAVEPFTFKVPPLIVVFPV